MRQDVGAPRALTEASRVASLSVRAQGVIGVAACKRAFAEGHALTADEVVTYALREADWGDLREAVAGRLAADEGGEVARGH